MKKTLLVMVCMLLSFLSCCASAPSFPTEKQPVTLSSAPPKTEMTGQTAPDTESPAQTSPSLSPPAPTLTPPTPSTPESSTSESSTPESTTPAPSTPDDTQPPRDERTPYVFVGVKDYGKEGVDFAHADSLKWRFFANGKETLFKLDDKTFNLQNELIEGALYFLETENETIRALERAESSDNVSGIVEKLPDGTLSVAGKAIPETVFYRVTVRAGGALIEKSEAREDDLLFWKNGDPCGYLLASPGVYIPPVLSVPGEKTLKNFLLTALTPVGCTLYVYGGGWNWQDDGASIDARTIGLPRTWYDFFISQNRDYSYKAEDPSRSFYPTGSFNEYGRFGADCSGYLGWAIYNVVETESGKEGYVGASTGFAKRLASYGWGEFSKNVWFGADDPNQTLRPGDIVSIKGHVYISLGTCPDGSVLILHCSPTASRSGSKGGGVQISAIGNREDCQALTLAKQYMSTYYNSWSARYEAALVSPDLYLDFSHENAGRFRFSPGALLTDPDGVSGMSPKELLAYLFTSKKD